MSLDAFEHAAQENGVQGTRHTINNISAIQDSAITGMAKMNVIASVQPFCFYKDQYYELEKATRKMWDEGITIASSSDYPPTPDYRPLNAIETGVTRNSPYPKEQDTDIFVMRIRPSLYRKCYSHIQRMLLIKLSVKMT